MREISSGKFTNLMSSGGSFLCTILQARSRREMCPRLGRDGERDRWSGHRRERRMDVRGMVHPGAVSVDTHLAFKPDLAFYLQGTGHTRAREPVWLITRSDGFVWRRNQRYERFGEFLRRRRADAWTQTTAARVAVVCALRGLITRLIV